MEELQKSYVNAVAAAAGCIVGDVNIDDGVDLTLKHKADGHTAIGDKTSRLEIQLKATHQGHNAKYVSVQMRKDRYDYFRTQDTICKIVVIMRLPDCQENWILSSPEALSIRHCAYWVNLANQPLSSAAEPTVKASLDNVFDDLTLCEMMTRIGQGGKP